MARAGRKPKPTAMKELEGNPGRRKLNKREPKVNSGIPVCPSWLLPEAKSEWKRLAKKLHQIGILTVNDRTTFAAYCQSYARWKEANEHLEHEGSVCFTKNGFEQPSAWVSIANTSQKLMMQAAAEFGLTPSVRSRLAASSEIHDSTDDMEKLLNG